MNNYSTLKEYEAHSDTLAVVAYRDPVYQSIIYEKKDIYLCQQTPTKIIQASCQPNGASYGGRKDYANYATGKRYKLPILIQESRNVLAFPTHSTDHMDCSWIFATHVNTFYSYQNNKATIVIFKSDLELILPISAAIFRRQLNIGLACLGFFNGRQSE